MSRPFAGKHYPRSLGEFQAWFRTDADCLDYLEWLRWPDGFICPECSHGVGWLFATGKDGISALSLERTLEIGSYPDRLGHAASISPGLGTPGPERLAGVVEVDETFIGGLEPGLAGGRARGKKVLTGIAVEIHEPKGMGRCRMLPLADASAHVEPGARVITDGWQGYRGLEKLGYVHDRRSQRAAGDPPGLGERDSPRQLPERVRLPVQPPPLSQPRHGVLPGSPTPVRWIPRRPLIRHRGLPILPALER